MLFNYRPRAPSDAVLGNEIQEERSHFDNIKQERKRVGIWIKEDQRKQKERYDLRRRRPHIYIEGDLVLIQKQTI